MRNRPKLGIASGLLCLVPALLTAQFKSAPPAQYPDPQAQQSQYPPVSGDQGNAPYGPDQAPPADGTQAGPGQSPGAWQAPEDQQHGVARISLVGGEVNIRRAVGATVGAVANAPLTAQDHLLTGNRSSAEIQLDAATILRVAQNSDFSFANLEAQRFQGQLGIGSITYRLLQPTALQGEIDTPNIAVQSAGPAELRIYVPGDGTTLISVRSGEAQILGPAGSERLAAGHAYVVRGNPNDPEFQEAAPPALDTFDKWSTSRDTELSGARSYSYVSPEIPGAGDLDQHGTWVNSTYGQVWEPSGMPADWAPYSSGQWAYDGYYGWTWVDSAPWGWAPYHYGRWFFNGGFGWCWWPGTRGSYHYWSPALVGFFGFGSGNRGLGWVPLAPYERLHAWWGPEGRSYSYGVYNRSGIFSSYRNASYRNAATFARGNGFVGSGQHFDHLSREQLGGAAVVSGRLPFSPNRESYNFASRQAFSSNHFVQSPTRPFVSSRSFAGNGNSVNYPSRSVNPGWSRPGMSTAPPVRSLNQTNSQWGNQNRNIRIPSSAAQPGGNGSGWGRFGDPGSSSSRQGFTGPGANSSGPDSGWHQFGRPAAPRSTYGPPARDFGSSPSRSYSPPSQHQQFSAPRPSYQAPAPRSFSGGGSGGNHSGGGNSGGGSHSSGGGGGHGHR